jgi:hypothetical protein
MTQDEIIEMARQAGLKNTKAMFRTVYIGNMADLERFAKLVAQHEYVRADTTPPQRKWVGLTDAEVDEIYEQAETLVHDSWAGNGTVGLMFPITLYKMFEAKLKEKNT